MQSDQVIIRVLLALILRDVWNSDRALNPYIGISHRTGVAPDHQIW